MKSKLFLTVSVALFAAASLAEASLSLGNYSTGVNVDNNGVDKNWSITSVTTTAPATSDNTTRPAYLAKVADPSNQWPLNGPWVPNDNNSKWITYSSTLQTGGDMSGATYNYHLSFNTSGGNNLLVNWLSDNSSVLFVDSQEVSRATSEYSYAAPWNSYTIGSLTPGIHTLDLSVFNIPQSSGNPSGARVEFFAPVPEPSTILAGALLGAPMGVSILRKLRKKRV